MDLPLLVIYMENKIKRLEERIDYLYKQVELLDNCVVQLERQLDNSTLFYWDDTDIDEKKETE